MEMDTGGTVSSQDRRRYHMAMQEDETSPEISLHTEMELCPPPGGLEKLPEPVT